MRCANCGHDEDAHVEQPGLRDADMRDPGFKYCRAPWPCPCRGFKPVPEICANCGHDSHFMTDERCTHIEIDRSAFKSGFTRCGCMKHTRGKL